MDKDEKIALLTELLIDTEKKALDAQTKALKELSVIRIWVTFFGVISVISLVSGFIAAISALSRL